MIFPNNICSGWIHSECTHESTSMPLCQRSAHGDSHPWMVVEVVVVVELSQGYDYDNTTPPKTTPPPPPPLSCSKERRTFVPIRIVEGCDVDVPVLWLWLLLKSGSTWMDSSSSSSSSSCSSITMNRSNSGHANCGCCCCCC